MTRQADEFDGCEELLWRMPPNLLIDLAARTNSRTVKNIVAVRRRLATENVKRTTGFSSVPPLPRLPANIRLQGTAFPLNGGGRPVATTVLELASATPIEA